MDWHTDIQDWTKISDATAKLMLDQCELALKETIETSKIITEKSEKLVSILLPTITALVIYIFSHFVRPLSFLTLTAVFSLLVLLISLYFAYLTFKQYVVEVSGDYPERIFITQLIDNALTEKQQYLNLVLSIGENIQRKITFNKQQNSKRLLNIDRSMKILLLVIITPFLAYVLL